MYPHDFGLLASHLAGSLYHLKMVLLHFSYSTIFSKFSVISKKKQSTQVIHKLSNGLVFTCETNGQVKYMISAMRVSD